MTSSATRWRRRWCYSTMNTAWLYPPIRCGYSGAPILNQPLWTVWNQKKRSEDGHHGVSAQSHLWETLRRSVWADNDRGGRPSPIKETPEGDVQVVRIGARCRLYGCPPLDTAWKVGTGQADTASTTPPGSKGVQGVITVDGHQLTNGELSMEGNQLHQPTVTFHAQACGGHHYGTQQGLCNPPPVHAVWRVQTPGGDGSRTPRHRNVQDRGRVKAPLYLHHFLLGSCRDGFLGDVPDAWKGGHLQLPGQDYVLQRQKLARSGP